MLCEALRKQMQGAPLGPGIYLFKDNNQAITYIGKARSLKKRLISYLQMQGKDMRVDAILGASISIEFQETPTEIEALLLEARLIQMHQPVCNILLKSGQPFLYILMTTGDIPELKLVRDKKKRGSYIGPFLSKGSARKVYDFLIKNFALYRCNKKITEGCLYYHMGYCAGFCKGNVDLTAYKARIQLAVRALKEDREVFMSYLKDQIAQANAARAYEQSRQLHTYLLAFNSVYDLLATARPQHAKLFMRDIWIVDHKRGMILLFEEQRSVLTRKQFFYDPISDDYPVGSDQGLSYENERLFDYLLSYYREQYPAATILINFPIEDLLLRDFLTSWYRLSYVPRIVIDNSSDNKKTDHEASLMRMALLQAEKEWAKRALLPHLLQQMFGLTRKPERIDCFDISHKQGHFMVGSCVRFTQGEPDRSFFRKFYIETVTGIDDYAALREVVARRYKNPEELPDLVLIDGGKGQLSAVRDLLPVGRCMSIAKREERIFSDAFPEGKLLDQKSFVGQILIALRDYAHHFALSFHRATELRDTYKKL